jgi:hypothetical protein
MYGNGNNNVNTGERTVKNSLSKDKDKNNVEGNSYKIKKFENRRLIKEGYEQK